jgi:hypothetical protein
MTNGTAWVKIEREAYMARGKEKKTPLDYVEKRDELVPIQVRLPKSLVDGVKEKLTVNDLTFTDLVKGACHWYINDVDDSYNPILEKKSSGNWSKKKNKPATK